MRKVKFDHYFRYDELTEILTDAADSHPELVERFSIGKSFEGRDIWAVSITNRSTGEAKDKPAMLIDGNIHAAEVTATSVAVYHLVNLIEGYGTHEDITKCLDTRAFYIIPRVNPDGAELALADSPKFVRSSTRPYPFDEEPVSGLIAEDIDGDGRILSMRVQDSNGRWKKHADDPRLMVPREPTEEGGEYYQVFSEGYIENFDGVEIHPARPRQGLDMNRNWPSAWARDHKQPGAGPFPLSEPETYALAQFIYQHPNIFTWVAGHTFSGVLLRPGMAVSDDELPLFDMQHYHLVGDKGTELTGYPAMSVHKDFRVNKQAEVHGSTEWGYTNFGIFFWAPEYWAPHRTAGVKVEKYAEWFQHHPAEDELKMLAWSDGLDEGGYVDWYEHQHPQLGKVELGGWNCLIPIFNPPTALLEPEIAPFSNWFIFQLQMSPRLALRSSTVTRLENDLWQVQVVVENNGYLPTNGTEQALKAKAVRGVVAEIEGNFELVTGEPRVQKGQLAGRAGKSFFSSMGGDATDDRLKVVWILRGEKGVKVHIIVRHDRGGRVETELTLAG
ncbi:MAG: carboxypeptidase [Gammaproteobacteria bacterium]|nr:carboxypeptidase [Gammaproteobacteria bacterium]